MNVNYSDFFKTNVTLRITAIWALSESFLGGILHIFKLPFTGLILSFIASVCITLIALGNNKRGEIMKATLLVIAIKFMLSPHTPPMAYLAVLIQGGAGELLFLSKKIIKPKAFILTLFSLLYSAFQQLITLTIIFGKPFWNAIDIFLNKITQSFIQDSINYSLYIVVFYVGCYLLAGIYGGIFNITIINKIQEGNQNNLIFNQIKNLQIPESSFTIETKKSKNNNFKIAIGCLLLILLIASYFPVFKLGFLKSSIIEIIVRGVIIIGIWTFLITPILQNRIKKWITNFQEKNSNQIQQIILLFPSIKIIVQQSWLLSQNTKRRFQNFIYNTALLIVHREE